jgi:hypothetical protein
MASGDGVFRLGATEHCNAEPGRPSGDHVRLRSGGPSMIVAGIKGDQVDCYRTDWNGQINPKNFPIYLLEKS